MHSSKTGPYLYKILLCHCYDLDLEGPPKALVFSHAGMLIGEKGWIMRTLILPVDKSILLVNS